MACWITGEKAALFCFKAEEFLPNTAPKVQENPQALVKKLLQQAIHDKHLEADYPTLSAFTEWDDPCAIGRALALMRMDHSKWKFYACNCWNRI